MATLISDELRWCADQIVHHLDYTSAVLSGLAPDRAHLDRGGFHCSVEDLKAHGNGGDYSNTRADDNGFNPKYGAAFDISFSPADMVRAWKRVHTVWADKSDPRRKYLNAINGWDGSGDATRLDFDTGTPKKASSDHKWHDHGEVHRRYVRDMKAMRAIVSIYRGESKAAWIAREEPAAPKPPTTVEVKMVAVSGQMPELKRGMNDPINSWNMVTRLQRLLVVEADGDFGAGTEAAVVRFNKDALGRNSKIVDAVFWKKLCGIQ